MNEQHKWGIVIWGVIVLIILTMGFAYIKWGAKEPRDAETLCLLGKPPPAATALIVDKSDPLTRAQQAELKAVIKRLRRTLEVRERLSIYVLEGPTADFARAVFSLCNPGTGETANELYENPRLVQRKFDEQFGRPLDEMLARLLTGNVSPQSPILEMLRVVTTAPEFKDVDGRRRLILFSDLMQNVPDHSHYAERTGFGLDGYRAMLASAYADRVRVDLTGVHVEIYYLARANAARVQGDGHLDFWRAHFAHSGSWEPQIIRVE